MQNQTVIINIKFFRICGVRAEAPLTVVLLPKLKCVFRGVVIIEIFIGAVIEEMTRDARRRVDLDIWRAVKRNRIIEKLCKSDQSEAHIRMVFSSPSQGICNSLPYRNHRIRYKCTLWCSYCKSQAQVDTSRTLLQVASYNCSRVVRPWRRWQHPLGGRQQGR